MRTRTKICGITRVEDALCAVRHGADAIGLVFYAPSPRCVSVAQAALISAALPPFVSVVALFVNASQQEINAVLSNVRIDLLQFHGDELEPACTQYGLPYLKAIRVKPDTNLIQYAHDYANAKALLLDAYSDVAVGGTGLVFDWNLIPKQLPKPIILAGGLTPENVKQAIHHVRPFAVDVSGGVEQSKGIKDTQKIAAFMAAINA
ncbi:MAG: phosphoribosylanthranilate isomerase [Methylophilaceae bacterium]|nr:MAG: phosphoribosylanthranilate isomerase [Methylophilaceae bacterium]